MNRSFLFAWRPVRRLIKGAFFLFVLGAGAAAAFAVDVGKPAPDFRGKSYDGKEVALENYKGKVIVLEWFNPGCPFVQRHYKAKTMANTLKGFDANKVVWLAVDSTASNTAAATASWKKEQGFPYSVLLDTDGKVGHAYGAKTTPHMYVIDGAGKLAYAGAIDDDPRGSGAKVNYVDAALTAMTEGKSPDPASTRPYGCSVKY